MIYRQLFDHVLVRLDPEDAHTRAMDLIRTVAAVPFLSDAVRAVLGRRPAAPVTVPGLPRPVPGLLGLAAGMDKHADTVLGMDMLGFGFVEVGTVTARAQPGNERPRLWRELELGALRNRMGFNNDGAAAAGRRLQRLRRTRRGRRVIVGANIGKSKVTPLEEAVGDYESSAREVARWADYLVVNVSSPNTPGLRDLQSVEALRPILEAVQAVADRTAGRRMPLLVKIAPDLADADVDRVADLVLDLGLTGVVATNTTIAHHLGPGGLSGRPLSERAVDVVARLRARLGPDRLIIGVGGIGGVADARAMLAAGADLLQAYSAFVYEGPAWPGRVNRALAEASMRLRPGTDRA
ncbi:quinone-dependent dihydroorotate dehydrogenase [Georgenia deserti]|uniref:Dihydroorotate dehydrogenase (quinone) n=1 Tax=Georgenia deserti TaxID=2093781 RepID=A0ABW4LA97_9MICO